MTKNKFLCFVVTALILAVLTALPVLAEIEGAMGIIRGVDETYKAAPAVINAKGDGLSVDTDNAFVLSEANNTGLAGIYAVSKDDFATQTLVYVYGDFAERKAIVERNTYVGGGDLTDTDSGNGYGKTYPKNKVKVDGTKTYVVGIDENGDGLDDNIGKRVFVSGKGENAYLRVWNWSILQMDTKSSVDFEPGYYSGFNCNNYGWGSWASYSISRNIGYHITADQNKAFTNAKTTTAKKTAFDAIAAAVKDLYFSYALTSKEIIPISEVNKYTYKVEAYKVKFTNANHVVKFEAYVADENGNVSAYTYLHNPVTLGSTAATLVVDFKEDGSGTWETPLPEEGYFVGLRIYPCYGLTDYTKFTSTDTSASRIYIHHVDTGYLIDFPKTPKPTGLGIDENGKVTGLVEGNSYEYVNLNNTTRLKEFAENGKVETALVYSKLDGNTVLPAGIYAVRVAESADTPASDPAVLYVQGKGIANILHTNESDGTVIANGLYKGKGWREAQKHRDERAFAPGVWTGTLYSQTKYMTPLTLFNTGDDNFVNWSAEFYIDGSYTKEQVVHALESEYTSYQYLDSEIIPFSMFKSYAFQTAMFKTQYVAQGDVNTKVIFYVINEEGELEAREWLGKTDFAGSTTHAVKIEDFEDTTGYIIAIEIHPTGDIPDTTKIAATSAERTSYCITLMDGGYKINLPKVIEGNPELTVNETIVSGFDKKYTYEYANLNDSDMLAGFAATGTIMAEPEYTKLDAGVESIEFGEGLWAVRVAGEEGVSKASDMTVVLVRGAATSILHLDNDGSPITEKYPATGAALRNYTPLFKKGTWRGTLPAARSALTGNLLAFAYDAYATSVCWAGTDYNSGTLTYEALVDAVESDHMTYQFTDDEIIPVDDFISYTYKTKVRQGSINMKDGGKINTTFTVYAIQDDGSVKKYTLTDEMDFTGRSLTEHTFTREDLGNDATGYIVAFEIRPTGEVTDTAELYVDPEYLVADAYDIHLVSGGYVSRPLAPTPNGTSFPVIEGGHGNISGLKAEYLHEVRWSTDDGKTYTDWSDVPVGSTSFKVTIPGIYQIRVKESDAYVASRIATVNVLTADSIDTFNSQISRVYLTEDFVEVKADYEIDVTVKNWISTLSLMNLKEVTPDSSILVVGDGFKYQFTAENITVNDKIHYYNFDISFNGESRSDVNYKKFVEATGDLYVKNVYFESSNGLPFTKAELSIYVGSDYNGMELDSASYNERIDRLRYLEIVQVTDGWVTLTQFGEPMVLLVYED